MTHVSQNRSPIGVIKVEVKFLQNGLIHFIRLKRVPKMILFQLAKSRVMQIRQITVEIILERLRIMRLVPFPWIHFHMETLLVITVQALPRALLAAASPQPKPAARPTPPL